MYLSTLELFAKMLMIYNRKRKILNGWLVALLFFTGKEHCQLFPIRDD